MCPLETASAQRFRIKLTPRSRDVCTTENIFLNLRFTYFAVHMPQMACVVMLDLHRIYILRCQRATRRVWKRGEKCLSMEFHQCRGSDPQYELQTLSTFQQCKTATPVKVVCGWIGLTFRWTEKGKKEGMDVPHRFPPPAHVMWLGLVPQLLPGGGRREGREAVGGRGVEWDNYESLYICCLCAFNGFHYRLQFA